MFFGFSQTKVSGYVFDEYDQPVAFANVIFKGSTEGTITNEDGRFYLESENTWETLIISFLGYEMKEVVLEKKVNYDLRFVLKEEAAALDEVVIVSGKQSKKASENPAIRILKKIWERKRQNGLSQFKQYEYDKYEKVEFDLNTIDSALIKSKLFRGMEFVFEEVDTSKVTGKTYLPIFLNEAASRVYGDNILNKEKEDLKGNKNSGFSNNQVIIDFIDDLYADFNVYDNYLKFFDKSFVSPLSRTGIQTYNYVLSDSAFIDNKWCYNIIYYPRRKNELTKLGKLVTRYTLKSNNPKHSFHAISECRSIAEGVKENVDKIGIDVVVLTSKNSNSLGTTTEVILERIRSCPVLIVPPHAIASNGINFTVASGFQEKINTEEIERFFKALAMTNTQIGILVLKEQNTLSDKEADNLEVLLNYLKQLSNNPIGLEFLSPADKLADYAISHHDEIMCVVDKKPDLFRKIGLVSSKVITILKQLKSNSVLTIHQ